MIGLSCLGFQTIQDVEVITIAEYETYLEAYRMRSALKQQDVAMLAWQIQAVQATTGGKHPKPKYKTFKQFFDLQEAIEDARSDGHPKANDQKEILRRYAEWGKIKKRLRKPKEGGQ